MSQGAGNIASIQIRHEVSFLSFPRDRGIFVDYNQRNRFSHLDPRPIFRKKAVICIYAGGVRPFTGHRQRICYQMLPIVRHWVPRILIGC